MAKTKTKTKEKTNCNFCGGTDKKVGPLVKGHPVGKPEKVVRICLSCAKDASLVLSVDKKKKKSYDAGTLPSPKQLVDRMNEHIIGQEAAKRTMAIAVVNHYKRLWAEALGDADPYREIELEKSNVLLIGPTGCGKTLLAKTMAEFLDLPFAIGDATSITEAGYVGDDVESLLLRLIMEANGDINMAQNGILYIDEIDKIASSRGNLSITRDVSGEGVQQALLKIIEGSICHVPPTGGRKHPEQQCIEFDTSNILFICAGSFNGLEEVINKRVGKAAMGFNAEFKRQQDEKKEKDKNIKSYLQRITPDDLRHYGMIPEFIGRLPIITYVEQLSTDSLIQILTEPKTALLKQYQKLFNMDGVELEFAEAAVIEIAESAKKLNTGARALRSVVEKVMSPLMFDIPALGKTCRVDLKMVKELMADEVAA